MLNYCGQGQHQVTVHQLYKLMTLGLRRRNSLHLISLCVFLSEGEKLTEAEVDEVAKDCMDPEDEDGMIPYVRKYIFKGTFFKMFTLTLFFALSLFSLLGQNMPERSTSQYKPFF